MKPVIGNIFEVKRILQGFALAIKNHVESNMDRLHIFETQLYATSPTSILDAIMTLFDTLIRLMEQKMAIVRSSERETIDFNGLGFRSKSESNVQLKDNYHNTIFGCMVEFYVVMEHVHR